MDDTGKRVSKAWLKKQQNNTLKHFKDLDARKDLASLSYSDNDLTYAPIRYVCIQCQINTQEKANSSKLCKDCFSKKEEK